MRSRWSLPLVLAVVAVLIAGAWAPLASAQSVTTGRLSGRVVAEADGAALPGAQVVAIHLPTGTRYNTLTRADGRFDILNVRVGGPYEVTVTMDGFVETIRNEVYVALGEPFDNGDWGLRLYYRPMMRLVWLGGLVAFCGGLLALSDRRYRLAQAAAAERDDTATAAA